MTNEESEIINELKDMEKKYIWDLVSRHHCPKCYQKISWLPPLSGDLLSSYKFWKYGVCKDCQLKFGLYYFWRSGFKLESIRVSSLDEIIGKNQSFKILRGDAKKQFFNVFRRKSAHVHE